MKGKLLGVAAAGLLLSACAHAYPDLAVFPAPAPAGATDEVAPVLAEAADLQAKYSKGYKHTAKWQDLSQLPIIGTAAAAAWVLLNSHENAAKKAGKIGIVGLSYTAARDQLTARGMPDAYIAGHAALTCLIAEGSTFSGQSARERHVAFTDRLGKLTAKIEEVSLLRHIEPDPKKIGPYGEMLKSARLLADQAIGAGRTAETAALKQEGAFQGAAPVFKKAVSSISVRVASKGRVRPPVDFTTLRDQMAAAPEVSETGATAERALIGDAGKLVEDIVKATNELMATTARMTAGTPDYLKSLERVEGQCVDLAPK